MTDDGDTTATETVSYQFEIDHRVWRPWSNTVPRQTSLDSRLKTLIEQDLRASKRESNGDVSPKTIAIMASRIRIRSMNAIESIRDGDDPQEAIEQLEEITDIADAMEY